MQHLEHLTTSEDLSGTWCNANAVTSSIMEAVSLVTPVLEKFFIRTVNEGLSERTSLALRERCLTFIREEADHSRVHKKFNTSVLHYLGQTPPGLARLEALLDGTRNRLSLPSRLLLAAALEHFTAVLSKVYLAQEGRLDFQSAFAQALFAHHAREELAHRSVVFDLWLTLGTSGRFKRSLTVFTILLVGITYIAVAVPWILHRKTGKLSATLSSLLSFAVKNRSNIPSYSPLAELFSFVRRSYHPDHLVDDRATPVGQHRA
ncbi:MAG TPA: metal-dependent hydrolase [Gallionella sp.]|nr:metal-dependent hydrolase [Gallionella sp.]